MAQGHMCCNTALSVDYDAAAEESEEKILFLRQFSEAFNKIENKQKVSVITLVLEVSKALILRNKPTSQSQPESSFRLLRKSKALYCMSF